MSISRRSFITKTSALVGAAGLSRSGIALGAPGKPVESRSLITSTAKFDPVRPESARLIAQACKAIGFNVKANPIDYNQGIQKVIMQHDYDMFLVRLTGASIRVDPNVFIYQVHHASQHKKGGFNWTGYDNPEVNRLAEAQQSEMDAQKRRDLVYQAQALIDEDQPNAVLVYPQMTNAYREDRLANLVPQMGEGIGSFWTDVSMTVTQGDGYVRTGATVALKNLNPIAVKDANEFKELRLIYDRLLQVGPDGKVVPWVAESYTISSPTMVEMKLRDGVRFHDGKPLTAEDVVFSFDYHKQHKAPFFLAALEKIARVEATGRLSLRFTLSEPFAPLLVSVFASMFIIPKHIWQDIPEKVDVDDPLNFPNTEPVGSGPYKFDYWDRGKELKLSANPDHFGAPKVAGIIRLVYGSHDAMAAAIEKGECDRTRYILKPSLMEDLDKVPGCVGRGYPSHGFYCLSYNQAVAPFDDPAFRRALKYAMPKDLIRDVVLGGHAADGGSVIAPANDFWHNPDVAATGQDIRMAKKILEDAGYTWQRGKLHYPG